MSLFTIIPEGQAIVLSGGVYRQVPIYARAGHVYAKHGAGFVRLMRGGGTSHVNIKWLELDNPDGGHTEGQMYVDYAAQVLKK